MLIFMAVVLIEIAGFIMVGKQIGVFATLALIILGMVAGCVLLRIQGIGLLQTAQRELAQGRAPNREVFYGMLMVLGAILLIVPGFFTDIVGILLFIPAVRNILWHFASSRISMKTEFTSSYQSRDEANQTIIDLDAEDYHSEDPKNSPWRGKNDNLLP